MAPPNALGFDPTRLTRIDDWMQCNLDIGRFAGSSVLLARHGEIAHLSAVGKRSLEDDLSFETDTICRIYSMTKMIASVGLMMLVEKGRIHLDAPVSSYLPEFSKCYALKQDAVNEGDVDPALCPTIHQLLTHTSGLSYSFNEGLIAKIYETNKIGYDPAAGGLEAATKRVASVPLAFQPGARWEYSVGIDVIGRVIEVVSGLSLDTYLKEQIFEPLGMVDTYFGLPESAVKRFADCYLYPENVPLSGKNTPSSAQDAPLPGQDAPLSRLDVATSSQFAAQKVDTFSGGGGLLSTLDDYFRFGEMIRTGGSSKEGQRLLSPRTINFMRQNHLPGDIASMGPSSFAEMPMEGVGFGIGGATFINPALSKVPGSVGDFGWGGMASTYFWTDPVEDLTCIFFTQLIPSSAYPNRAELKALVHAALVD